MQSFLNRRTTTGLTGRDRGPSPNRRRTFSFKVRAEQPPPQRMPIEQMYPVYHLKWEKLKAFLEKRFPGHEFPERKVRGDHYVFEVPEALTSNDRLQIEKERDEPDPNDQVIPRRRRLPSPE